MNQLKKGKLGILINHLAVISFILSIFTIFDVIPLAFVVLFAFVIFVAAYENNIYLTKQSLDALYFSIAVQIITYIISWFFIGLSVFFSAFTQNTNSEILVSSFGDVIIGIILLLSLIILLISIIKVSNGKDANIPIISKLSDKSLNIIRVTPDFFNPPQQNKNSNNDIQESEQTLENNEITQEFGEEKNNGEIDQ